MLSIKLLIQHVWIDKLIMVGVGNDFKALVTTAFDVALSFDTSDHVLADVMPLFV